MKTEAWEAIARKVSALSGVVRTGDRIRAKWHDFQSRTKLKLIEQKKEKRKTGGGPPPPDLTQTEENVLNIIGKTATEGISGGIDTSEEVPVAVVSIDRPGLTMDTSDFDTDSNIHSIADSNDNGGKFIDSMYPDETEDIVPVLKRGRVSAKTSRSSESGRVTPDVTYLSETEDSGIAKKRNKVSATKSRPSESSITTVENSKYGSILSVENERLKVEQQRLEIEKQKLSVLQSISHSLNQMVGSNVRLSHSSNDDSTIYSSTAVPQPIVHTQGNVWNWSAHSTPRSTTLAQPSGPIVAAGECYLYLDTNKTFIE